MKFKVAILGIVTLALFLRIYKTSELLGFWFDQGRDAKVVWDILQNGKLTLIGPTTGIEGIFLGPFYYYLITPLYLLGDGDPSFVATILSSLGVFSVYLIYRIIKKYYSEAAGLLSALIYGSFFSFVTANRWLSNPTPLPITSLLSMICILLIIHKNSKIIHSTMLGVLLGLSLQFEAASAIFFLPATLIIFLVNKVNIRYYLFIIPGFISTLLPQLFFNFRHDHLLFKSFYNFIISNKSFQVVPIDFVNSRINFYYHSIFDKFFTQDSFQIYLALITVICVLMAYKYLPGKLIQTLLIWVTAPYVLLLFYHGNNGYVWDYYFTGIYPMLVMIFGISMRAVYINRQFMRGVVVILVFLSFMFNYSELYYFLSNNQPTYISYQQIRDSVDWVYEDVKRDKFNVDVYVPPVISHAYDYMFLWRGVNKYSNLPSQQRENVLYTLIEPDSDHANNRKKWIERQNGFSSIKEEKYVWPILIQERYRHEK